MDFLSLWFGRQYFPLDPQMSILFLRHLGAASIFSLSRHPDRPIIIFRRETHAKRYFYYFGGEALGDGMRRSVLES